MDTPINRRIRRLDTNKNIGFEMRAVYRQVRRGEIMDAHGKTLIYILNTIIATNRETDLEKRIEALESRS